MRLHKFSPYMKYLCWGQAPYKQLHPFPEAGIELPGLDAGSYFSLPNR